MCECLLFAIYLSSRLWRFIHIHLLGIIRFLSYLFSPDDVFIFAIISVNEWTLEQTVNVNIYRVRRLAACSHLVSLSANRCVVFLVSFILFPLRIITRIVRRLVYIYAVNRNRKRRYTLKERMTERNMNELQSVFFFSMVWYGTNRQHHRQWNNVDRKKRVSRLIAMRMRTTIVDFDFRTSYISNWSNAHTDRPTYNMHTYTDIEKRPI